MFKINKERGYWSGNDQNFKASHCFDEALSKGLVEFFSKNNPTSIVDLGCGMGDYVKILRAHGFCIDGFDGNPNTPEVTNGICGILDLSEPHKFKEPYDWVMSLEVGEHLPQRYETTFIENLVNNAKTGIVLSWAVKGQGGAGHFNEQNNDYIKQRMSSYGLVNDLEAEQMLRRHSSASWFKNTIMVFRFP